MKYLCVHCQLPVAFDTKKGWWVHPKGMKWVAKCEGCGWIGEARENRCPNCQRYNVLHDHHLAEINLSQGVKEE